MPPVNEWREFFDEYAPRYMDEPFVVGTVGEVDFVVGELALPPGARILDVGCGTGRHSVELARRGYRVTGVDQSQGMLDQAAAAAREAGVTGSVEWVRADAAGLVWEGEPFDAAICLCEGAFTLLGAADDPIGHDARILRSMHAALKPGAPVVLTALSAVRSLRELTAESLSAGAFSLETMVEVEDFTWAAARGERRFVARQRQYVPTELVILFRQAGFVVDHVGGGTAGAFARRPLELDDMEIMVIARKPGEGGAES